MDNSNFIIYAVLTVFVIAIIATAIVVKTMDSSTEFETQKIRFAAALFVGILLLVLIVAILAVVDTSGRGLDVFKTIMTGLSPIAGGIIGYLFSSSAGNINSTNNRSNKNVKHNK